MHAPIDRLSLAVLIGALALAVLTVANLATLTVNLITLLSR